MYTKQNKLTVVYAIQVKSYVYIGIASNLNKRIAAHKRALIGKNHHNNILQKLWNKYHELDYSVLEENITRNDIAEAEQFYIAYFKYIGASVVNLTAGGEGCFGRVLSETTKQKIIQSNLGQKRSLIARENMRNGHLGKKRSKESIEKGAAKLRGIPKQQHVIDSLIKSRQKTYNVTIIDPNGNTYSPIINAAAFARNHNLPRRQILDVINGVDKQYKGWRLKT